MLTAKDIIDGYGYKTSTVTLSTPFPDGKEKTFEIQSISQGDFISIVGTPMLLNLAFKEGNTDAIEDEKEYENHINIIKKIVCAGVLNVKFVDKPQKECKENEVSINLLTLNDLIELYNLIMELSLEGLEKVSFFPEKSE